MEIICTKTVKYELISLDFLTIMGVYLKVPILWPDLSYVSKYWDIK